MLILERAQAGLSRSTILHKRANYQRAFAPSSTRKSGAASTRPEEPKLLLDPGIVRNRLKIDSTVTNAPGAHLEVQREFPIQSIRHAGPSFPTGGR